MSSPPICRIAESSPRIRIKDLHPDTEEEIREVMKLGWDVQWNNQGVVRRIPNGILVDVFEAYDFWTKEPDKLQVDMPKDVGVFFWGDTMAIHQRPPSP